MIRRHDNAIPIKGPPTFCTMLLRQCAARRSLQAGADTAVDLASVGSRSWLANTLVRPLSISTTLKSTLMSWKGDELATQPELWSHTLTPANIAGLAESVDRVESSAGLGRDTVAAMTASQFPLEPGLGELAYVRAPPITHPRQHTHPPTHPSLTLPIHRRIVCIAGSGGNHAQKKRPPPTSTHTTTPACPLHVMSGVPPRFLNTVLACRVAPPDPTRHLALPVQHRWSPSSSRR